MTTSLTSLHQYSMANQATLAASLVCGCFYCCKLFEPTQVRNWAPERNGDKTALCPHCGIDAVLPAHGLPTTLDQALLERMHEAFFS